jgi:hypothetical protein
MDTRDRRKLVRILNLLGSDQPGERAAAALAAHNFVQGSGEDWSELLSPKPGKVEVRRVREWDVNHKDAAESRIRQLKSTTERQERQIRALRTRVATLTDRERKRLAGTDEADVPGPDGSPGAP